MDVNVSSRSRLVSYAIRDIVLEAKVLEKQGKDMIYLNIGDPAPYGFRPPQHILEGVKKALDQNFSGYCPAQGDPELVKAAAEFENIPEEDIFVTTGLSEGIDFLFQALLDPGHNIILPSPLYPLYITKSRLSYGSETFYECDENWEPDIDSLRKNINSYTQAIVLINPNNPTGAVYSRSCLEEIINIAGEHSVPIISDNAYDMLVFDGEYHDIRKLHKDVPLILGSSISKNFMYPGARVGWLAFHGHTFGPLKDAIMRLCNQRLSVNWEMQRGAIEAIRGPKTHIESFKSSLKERRDLVIRRIQEIEGLSLASPKGAFYAFPKVEGPWKNDWEFCRELLKYGVVTVPGQGFSSTLKGLYFRLVFLPNQEILNEAFNRIERMMKDKTQS
jgi:aspartate/methionine/tyrosine aminotransferase